MITRQAVSRRWLFTCPPPLGDPSEPSLASQTAEPLAPIHPAPHPTILRDAPEPRRSTLDPDRGYYGEAQAKFLWGYGDVSGRLGRYSIQ